MYGDKYEINFVMLWLIKDEIVKENYRDIFFDIFLEESFERIRFFNEEKVENFRKRYVYIKIYFLIICKWCDSWVEIGLFGINRG